jgi:pimeloyl-ACP methyl ester carboxylesterase
VIAFPALPGVAHRDVDLGGVRLHVAEMGDGPPLLLLHGWPQHWWSWRHVMPDLARSFRVIAPDLRGFGWSDAPPGRYAKHTFARDVIALLDADGIERAALLGHDWGGYTALLVALEHPERIERVVALDIVPPWPQLSLPRPRHLALPVLASYQVLLGAPLVGRRLLMSQPGFVRSLIRAGSGPLARWTDDELDIYADVLRDPRRAAASAACYRTFLTRELPVAAIRGDRSDALQVPSLLAMGEHSAIHRILRPRSEHNLQIATIPAAGHFLPEEAPAAVLSLARRWLEA